MVRDTASSHLHIASCYDDSEDSHSEMLKRPLISTTRSSNDSLEAEDDKQDKQQDKGLVCCQAFLLGSAIGFLLEVMGFATWYIIFNVWGQNPTISSTWSLVSYWILTSCGQVSVVIYICFWLVVHQTRTKSGYMYQLRKKLDQDADNTPASSSKLIWSASPSRLFVVGVYFLLGVTMGTFSVSTLIAFYKGVADRSMALPYVVVCVLFWLVLKSFECEQQKTHGEEQSEQEEEEEGDDYSFL
jgi:hypothetical protein